MINEKIKFRNAILSDAKHLSKIESNIFPLDKVNTNFQNEISKETKKVFICTYENIVKPKKNLLSFIKPDKSKANQEFNTEEIIIGYIKIWKVLEESHIEQIGVIEKFRGQGIGEKLLVLSLRYCWENNIKKILLECRKSNSSAIKLYKKYLFNIVSVRKNYYPLNNSREDAICFESVDISTDDYYKKFLIN
ncbi:MAG: ribosomal protein S18-alanine N-acetyltransferase [Candidatus Thalassarchaeaceae archaeon]|nr:ribosomal-protein-alanine N-acetyltransferase [SAR202 cluster bacterium]OUU77801.1 MAG: ribosomal-protein-alanine N-acetyltransferase [Chloroflexi bacterium TMED70]RZP16784.1 MAG: ribosomal-protein-alanine N-acetyltransferase [Chloroflexota bacterium]|tara:strand:- start:15557 stop:16132 length:576 start_codon:yes stop_codon:yes gene_type:complete